MTGPQNTLSPLKYLTQQQPTADSGGEDESAIVGLSTGGRQASGLSFSAATATATATATASATATVTAARDGGEDGGGRSVYGGLSCSLLPGSSSGEGVNVACSVGSSGGEGVNVGCSIGELSASGIEGLPGIEYLPPTINLVRKKLFTTHCSCQLHNTKIVVYSV